MEPLQMASSLTETFYDLNSTNVHPNFHHPTYHPSPHSMWSSRVDTFPSSLSYPPVNTRYGEQDVGAKRNVSRKEDKPDHASITDDWVDDEEETEECIKEAEKGDNNNGPKHSQVAATLYWLSENYERAEGVCLPRCVLYAHYLDFCKKSDFTPAGAATFGKIIRQKFPKLTTRRLGTRGQSKYHYYGIGIKETSIYYHSVYSGRGLTRFSGVKIKTDGSNRKYSLSSKTGTLLPDFPEVGNLILPEDVSTEKMETFLMMYRTHCQRILDTVIGANFDEVQNLLLHFWQGMPSHLTQVLGADVLCDIVALCDSILYKVLADVLLPSSIQDLPDSLGTEIKVFSRKLPAWVDNAFDSIPDNLRERKMEATRWFVQSVRRQLSFVHLAQTARSVLSSQESIAQMVDDLNEVDFRQIFCQAVYTQSVPAHRETIMEFFLEFKSLLKKQAPVESYTEWIDGIVDIFVLQPCKDKGCGFRDSAASFLLQWAMFGSLLMKELTLHNASSFGSFHLFHVMLDEYVFLVLETQREQSRDLQLQRLVQRHMKNAEVIKTQAKVRTSVSKITSSSPKTRKRKQEDLVDSADEVDHSSSTREMRIGGEMHFSDEKRIRGASPTAIHPHAGTAFTRLQVSIPRDPNQCSPIDADKVTAHAYPALPASPVKPIGSLNGVTYAERPSYLPQFNLNTFSDYTTATSRVQNYSEHPSHPQSAFPPVTFSASMSGISGGYWTDSRAHAVLGDTYPQYGHHGVTSAYGSAAFIRSTVYGQDALGINSARGYFHGRAAESFQGSPLALGSQYGGNFMEIAPNGAQYPRHDPMPAYHDDRYTHGMPPPIPGLHKHYLTAPFR